jgi:hypothetical protein
MKPNQTFSSVSPNSTESFEQRSQTSDHLKTPGAFELSGDIQKIKLINFNLKQLSFLCQKEFQGLDQVEQIVNEARLIFETETKDNHKRAQRPQWIQPTNDLPFRNIATYNHMISIYHGAFQAQLELSKTTLKEKKDIQRKQSQQNFREKIKYVLVQFEIFQTMREVKNIFPDSTTLSTLLKSLKVLHKNQLLMPSHPLHLN